MSKSDYEWLKKHKSQLPPAELFDGPQRVKLSNKKLYSDGYGHKKTMLAWWLDATNRAGWNESDTDLDVERAAEELQAHWTDTIEEFSGSSFDLREREENLADHHDQEYWDEHAAAWRNPLPVALDFPERFHGPEANSYRGEYRPDRPHIPPTGGQPRWLPPIQGDGRPNIPDVHYDGPVRERATHRYTVTTATFSAWPDWRTPGKFGLSVYLQGRQEWAKSTYTVFIPSRQLDENDGLWSPTGPRATHREGFSGKERYRAHRELYPLAGPQQINTGRIGQHHPFVKEARRTLEAKMGHECDGLLCTVCEEYRSMRMWVGPWQRRNTYHPTDSTVKAWLREVKKKGFVIPRGVRNEPGKKPWVLTARLWRGLRMGDYLYDKDGRTASDPWKARNQQEDYRVTIEGPRRKLYSWQMGIPSELRFIADWKCVLYRNRRLEIYSDWTLRKFDEPVVVVPDYKLHLSWAEIMDLEGCSKRTAFRRLKANPEKYRIKGPKIERTRTPEACWRGYHAAVEDFIFYGGAREQTSWPSSERAENYRLSLPKGMKKRP